MLSFGNDLARNIEIFDDGNTSSTHADNQIKTF